MAKKSQNVDPINELTQEVRRGFKKLDQKIDREIGGLGDRLEKKIDQEVGGLAAMTAKGFNEVTDSFKDMNNKIVKMDQKVSHTDQKVSRIEILIHNIDRRLAILEKDRENTGALKDIVRDMKEVFKQVTTREDLLAFESRLIRVERLAGVIK